MPAVERPPLTRRRIIDAAVALVDEQGLDALSMRRLGATLGVEAMSLYNHVANKDDILDAMLGQVLGEVALPTTGSWEDRLRDLARSFRQVGRRHPGVLPLVGSRAIRSVEGIAPLEAAFAILRAAGLPPAAALDALVSAASFVFGFALIELGGFREVAEGRSIDVSAVAADEHPALVELAAALDARDGDHEFEVGLEIVVAGIRRLLDAPG